MEALDDQETGERGISVVFEKEESENRKAAESRDVQDARGGGKT
jgi:hypothetical protein